LKTNVLLAGKPGVGKTTIIQKIVKKLEGKSLAGFYTEEFRGAGGARQGFRIVTLDGQTGILAEAGFKSPANVGRYGVNLAGIEELINPTLQIALEEAVDLLVIDEIGKMEIASEKFQELVVHALNSTLTVLATVPGYKLPFTDKLKMLTRNIRL